MTPAEQLAKSKQRKRSPRNTVAPRRPIWVCRLREMREALNLSLRDVADAVGMSNPGLWAVEHGGETSLTTATKLAEFFGCTIQDLWPERAKP